MSVFAELHDGRKLEFPDGTDPAIVQSTVKKVLGVKSMADQIPGMPPQPASYKDNSSFLDKAVGAGEAALNVGTGLVGMVGALPSFATEALRTAGEGPYPGDGPRSANNRLQKAYAESIDRFTYDPSTEKGKEYAGNVGDIISRYLIPMAPVAGTMGASRTPSALELKAKYGRESVQLSPQEAFIMAQRAQGKTIPEANAAWKASQAPKDPVQGQLPLSNEGGYSNYSPEQMKIAASQEALKNQFGAFFERRANAEEAATLTDPRQDVVGQTLLNTERTTGQRDLFGKDNQPPETPPTPGLEPLPEPPKPTLEATRKSLVETLDSTPDLTPAHFPIIENSMRDLVNHAFDQGFKTFPLVQHFIKETLGSYYPRVASFVKAAWEYVKEIQPGLSIRGNVQEALAKTVGITTEKQARYNALVEENKGILSLASIKRIHNAREVELAGKAKEGMQAVDPSVDKLPRTVKQFVQNFGGITTEFQPWVDSVKKAMVDGLYKPFDWNRTFGRKDYFDPTQVRVLSRNPILARVSANILRALGQAEKNASNFLSGQPENTIVRNSYKPGGGFYSWATLLKSDWSAKKAVIDLGFEGDRRGSYFTEAELRGRGLSDKQVASYNEMSKMFTGIWDAFRKAMLDTGNPDPGARAGYWPDIRKGDFAIRVKDKATGELLMYETTDSLSAAKEQAAKIEQHFKDLGQEVAAQADIRRGRAKLEDALSTFDALYQFVGNAKGEKAQLVREFHTKLLAETGAGVAKYTQHKEGFGGAAGNEFGKTPKEQAQNFEKAVEYYVRQVTKATETIKMQPEISKILTDLDLRSKDPHAIDFAEQYWNHYRGVYENELKFIDTLTEEAAVSLGFGRSAPRVAMQAAKSVLSAIVLLFGKGTYLAANMVQPFDRAVRGLSMAQSYGIKTSPVLAVLEGTVKAFDPANLNSANRAYAIREHISTPQLINDLSQGLSARVIMNKLGGGFVSKIEKVSRYLSFMILSNELLKPANRALLAEHGVKTTDQVLDLCRTWSDTEMTDYRREQRAEGFSKLGTLGEGLATFASFNRNSVGHNYHYFQLAKAGDARPLAYSVTVLMAKAGLIGFPGVMALQQMVNLINKGTGNNFDGPEDIIVKHVPDSIAYGASGTMDNFVNLSPSMGEGSPIPGEGRVDMNMVAPIAWAYETTKDLMSALMEVAVNGKSSTEKTIKLGYNVLPAPAHVALDAYGAIQVPGQGKVMIRDPSNAMHGGVRRDPFGTNANANIDWASRALGSESVRENKIKRIGNMQQRMKENIAGVRKAEFDRLYRLYGENVEAIPAGETKKLVRDGMVSSVDEFRREYKSHAMNLLLTKGERATGIDPNAIINSRALSHIHMQGEQARNKQGLRELWK